MAENGIKFPEDEIRGMEDRHRLAAELLSFGRENIGDCLLNKIR